MGSPSWGSLKKIFLQLAPQDISQLPYNERIIRGVAERADFELQALACRYRALLLGREASVPKAQLVHPLPS